MELPIWILPGDEAAAVDEPLLCVDGAWTAAGLHLSHWPGNATPAELRHDLSTGCALAFARLPAEERERRCRGLAAIANNHLDTDGNCALWAVSDPDAALPRAERLLEAAAAGDFFRVPSEDAFCVDMIVPGVADPLRSPLGDAMRGASDRERYERTTHFLLERFGAILDGDLSPYRSLWQPALDALRADRADLERAARADLVHLDWTWWTAPADSVSSRGADAFDPGRHALFGSTTADRILTVGPGAAGTTYRFVLGTRSWFDLVSPPPPPRPDLGSLAEHLNRLEGCEPAAAVAWRAQPTTSASPELWFGTGGHALFAEHSAGLRPSALPPERVRSEIATALRTALVLPD